MPPRNLGPRHSAVITCPAQDHHHHHHHLPVEARTGKLQCLLPLEDAILAATSLGLTDMRFCLTTTRQNGLHRGLAGS
jgi:hypothetical protein